MTENRPPKQDLTRLSDEEQERLRAEMSRFGQAARRNSLEAAIWGFPVGAIPAAVVFAIGWFAGIDTNLMIVFSGAVLLVGWIWFWRIVT